jgi:hypothetical protein
MEFALVCVLLLALLGVVAAVATVLSRGGTDDPVVDGHDCSTCSSVATGECKLGCLMEEKKRRKDNKSGCL